ncbi:MAG: triose-phosphate isomerase [Clostridia bacterium]|nr:triose-phosphate isomerase [Clostridia bacterium]
MKKWYIANFKMSKEVEGEQSIVSYAEKFIPLVEDVEDNIIICTPFIHLSEAVCQFLDSEVMVGAENCAQWEAGAYTGEVSATMLDKAGVKAVILGHSERRNYFGENNEIVNKKVKLALKNGLIPVVCLSFESEEEFTNTLKDQLDEVLTDIDSGENILIAFEPTFAIGTGKALGKEEVKEFTAKIKEKLKEKGFDLPVLYGGSVKPDNAKDFVDFAGADGLLVGGASLDPEKFAAICKCTQA